MLLTEEDKRKHQIRSRISVARFVEKYLAAHKLPCAVRSFRCEEGDFIIVQNKRPQYLYQGGRRRARTRESPFRITDSIPSRIIPA